VNLGKQWVNILFGIEVILFILQIKKTSRDSVVSITTRLWAGWSWPRIPVGEKSSFPSSNHSDRLWDQPSLRFCGYRGSFSGVKWPGHPSSMEFKNEWSCTSTYPICLHGMNRDSFNLRQWPTWCTNFLNRFITIIYMFRAISCSSSGGQIVLMQYLVSSLSVSDHPVHRLRKFFLNLCTGRSLTESDDTRYCINLLKPSGFFTYHQV